MMNQACNVDALSDAFDDIETAMNRCSSNSQCFSILNSNCDGTKFELCSDGYLEPKLQSCVHPKQRNKIS